MRCRTRSTRLAASLARPALGRPLVRFSREMRGDPERIGGNRQRRIDPAARREKRRIHYIEILQTVRAAHGIENARMGIGAESAGAARMSKVLIALRLLHQRVLARTEGSPNEVAEELNASALVEEHGVWVRHLPACCHG